jgi:hypothetical protein
VQMQLWCSIVNVFTEIPLHTTGTLPQQWYILPRTVKKGCLQKTPDPSEKRRNLLAKDRCSHSKKKADQVERSAKWEVLVLKQKQS